MIQIQIPEKVNKIIRTLAAAGQEANFRISKRSDGVISENH